MHTHTCTHMHTHAHTCTTHLRVPSHLIGCLRAEWEAQAPTGIRLAIKALRYALSHPLKPKQSPGQRGKATNTAAKVLWRQNVSVHMGVLVCHHGFVRCTTDHVSSVPYLLNCFPSSVRLCVCACLPLSFSLFVFLSLSLSLFVFLSLSLSVCLSPSLCFSMCRGGPTRRRPRTALRRSSRDQSARRSLVCVR